MKTTIYDVANKAGVSIATVSKVINNNGKLRQSTREKVLETMEALNYMPSMMASALTGKKTEILGLLVPDISNPFFSEMARIIEDRANDLGMSLIICSTDDSVEKEQKYLELLRRKQVDGFIIASPLRTKESLKFLHEEKIPIVLLTQDDPELGCPSVSVDDFKGGYEATSFLASKGFKDIVIFAEHAHSSKMRIVGYKEALETHGIEASKTSIYRMTGIIENGYELMKQLIESNRIPEAVFACNDLISMGVIQAAREKGVSIPDELALVGFDDTILAKTTVPALTTIAQPIQEMGKRVVDVINEEIKEGIRIEERILYNPKLIIRDTV
ncbi:LacI family DNA-binding transcriptional regulator [Thalassobacillus sp. CUG 92003]|uniref:LacI family DNA-binding transcriptional regulator n=1 Tax=Thalassobacillus sp. CUG 92003 TaxID=2736641 RepID=UPI0015E790DE|nr:LacI family DNA-binding transcriptional regulator [Thalassobacillus sp. CUG 92003]